MRILNSSPMGCIRAATSLQCWRVASCLAGALVFSCAEEGSGPGSTQARTVDQLLEQLQRASPLQRQAGGAEAPVVATVQAPVNGAEARAVQLSLGDAGARRSGAVNAGAVNAGAVSPDAVSPDAVSPDAVSPDAVSPDAVSPDVVEPGVSEPAEPSSPGAASPDAGAPVSEPEAREGAASPDAGASSAEPPRDIVAAAALPLHALVNGELLSEAQLWELLQQAPVTCFGELHDRLGDHFAETRALAEAVARANGAPLALGLEMFQRPFQAPLSAYVRGELDEPGLIAATEYVERWGWDFAFYRPLLQAARSAGLPTLALNAPRELTREIGRTGLESLDESERAQLPELDLEDAEHREFIFSLLGAVGHELQLALENVYVAQTVWDETMAETSASWLGEAGPEARLLIVAGAAHCHESAIPRRITRRLPSGSGLEVTSLAVALASELGTPGFSTTGYDVLVVLEDVPLATVFPLPE